MDPRALQNPLPGRLTFDELYQMQLPRNSPLFNVQQMQARMPNWLRAPQPPNTNPAAVRNFNDVMGLQMQMDLQKMRQQEQQRANLENERRKREKLKADQEADVEEMRQVQRAKTRELKIRTAQRNRKMIAQEAFIMSLPPEQRAAAAIDPEGFSAQIAKDFYRKEDESNAMRVYNEAGGPQGTGMPFGQWYGSDYKGGGPTINVGGDKYGSTPPGMVRRTGPQGQAYMEKVPGSPAAQTTDEQIGMESLLSRLDEYDRNIDRYGTELLPGPEKQKMRTEHGGLVSDIGKFFRFKQMTRDEMALVGKTLPDPTALESQLKSREQLKAASSAIRAEVIREAQMRGFELRGQSPTGQSPTMQATPGWNATPSGARWMIE